MIYRIYLIATFLSDDNAISFANFLSYDLTINDTVATVTLMNTKVFGAFPQLALNATPTELTWNFGPLNTVDLIFTPGTFAPDDTPPCFELHSTTSSGGFCKSRIQGMAITAVAPLGSAGVLSNSLTGVQVFATVPPPVPEPGTLGLLGAGLVALGGMAKRKLNF